MEKYKITKLQKILEVNNSVCHNFYYMAYFRLYNKEHTKYKKGKFVIWFDVFDVQEYYEQDYYTQDNIKQLASELAINTLATYYKSYTNTQELNEYCCNSITDFYRINN